MYICVYGSCGRPVARKEPEGCTAIFHTSMAPHLQTASCSCPVTVDTKRIVPSMEDTAINSDTQHNTTHNNERQHSNDNVAREKGRELSEFFALVQCSVVYPYSARVEWTARRAGKQQW